MLSFAPKRVKVRSTMVRLIDSAGTKLPICAKMQSKATCLMNVDFPPIFAPVISSKNLPSLPISMPNNNNNNFKKHILNYNSSNEFKEITIRNIVIDVHQRMNSVCNFYETFSRILGHFEYLWNARYIKIS